MSCICCHVWTIFRLYSDIFGHIRTIFGHIRIYSNHIRTYSDIFEHIRTIFGPWAGPWAGSMGRAMGRARAGPGPGPGKTCFLAYDINKKDAQCPYDPFAGGIASRSLLCVRTRRFLFLTVGPPATYHALLFSGLLVQAPCYF